MLELYGLSFYEGSQTSFKVVKGFHDKETLFNQQNLVSMEICGFCG